MCIRDRSVDGLEYSTAPLGEGVTAVRLTAGVVSASSDPATLPLGDLFSSNTIERLVREAKPDAVICRPSLVIGPEDDFFNRFAVYARLFRWLPLIGGGHTRFQPVYVGDVADAIVAALGDPAARGQTYELGGPAVYSFRELMDLLLAETGRRCLLVPVPFWLAEIQAGFLEWLPTPPLTRLGRC